MITDIRQQDKNKDKVSIYIDGEFFLGVSKEIMYKLKLNKGMSIDQDKLQQIVDQQDYFQAKTAAFNILGRSMQSEHMLRLKLSRKGYKQHIIDKVVSLLKRYNMINDKEMACMIVKDKVRVSRYGKNKIKQYLYQKGIDMDIINDVLISKIDHQLEFDNALYHARKKLKSIRHEHAQKIYQKLVRHLISKGFDYDVADKVVRHLHVKPDNMDIYK